MRLPRPLASLPVVVGALLRLLTAAPLLPGVIVEARSCQKEFERSGDCPPEKNCGETWVTVDAPACRKVGTKSFCSVSKTQEACETIEVGGSEACEWNGRRCDRLRGAAGGGGGGDDGGAGGGDDGGGGTGGREYAPGSRKYCRANGGADEDACLALEADGCAWRGGKCRRARGRGRGGGEGGVGDEPEKPPREYPEGSRRYCRQAGTEDVCANEKTGCAWDGEDEKCRRDRKAGRADKPPKEVVPGSREDCLQALDADACNVDKGGLCRWDADDAKCRRARGGGGGGGGGGKPARKGTNKFCHQSSGGTLDGCQGLPMEDGCVWNADRGKCQLVACQDLVVADECVGMGCFWIETKKNGDPRPGGPICLRNDPKG